MVRNVAGNNARKEIFTRESMGIGGRCAPPPIKTVGKHAGNIIFPQKCRLKMGDVQLVLRRVNNCSSDEGMIKQV